MHFASRMTLSGIALSGVAMISFRTLAEASIRLAMSESSLSLSAAQLTPIKMEQMLSTRRHLGNTEEILLIFVFVLFCAPRVVEHLLIVLRQQNYSERRVAFYPAEAVNGARTFLKERNGKGATTVE